MDDDNWVIQNILKIKYFLLASIVASAAYMASALGTSETYLELILLSVSILAVSGAGIFAAKDLGFSLLYNRASQEGLKHKKRKIMYLLMGLALLFFFFAMLAKGSNNINSGATIDCATS